MNISWSATKLVLIIWKGWPPSVRRNCALVRFESGLGYVRKRIVVLSLCKLTLTELTVCQICKLIDRLSVVRLIVMHVDNELIQSFAIE